MYPQRDHQPVVPFFDARQGLRENDGLELIVAAVVEDGWYTNGRLFWGVVLAGEVRD